MDCLFCKIIAWEIPSTKIWEDEKHIAILDIFPNCKWQALLIPKKHFDSDAFDMPIDDYTALMWAAQKVAKLLEKGLKVQRVAMVMEWMWVNHVHIKFYPLHGLDEKFTELRANEKVRFDRYEWYITTQIWNQADFWALEKIAEEIRNA
jgi:histidine triad (HIT) family protein